MQVLLSTSVSVIAVALPRGGGDCETGQPAPVCTVFGVLLQNPGGGTARLGGDLVALERQSPGVNLFVVIKLATT